MNNLPRVAREAEQPGLTCDLTVAGPTPNHYATPLTTVQATGPRERL